MGGQGKASNIAKRGEKMRGETCISCRPVCPEKQKRRKHSSPRQKGNVLNLRTGRIRKGRKRNRGLVYKIGKRRV